MRFDSSDIPEEFSFEKEKEIARSFAQRFQWEMMAIGIGQALVWLLTWYLVINSHISILTGFFVATICACLAYLPSHEAQHGNYSRGNKKMKWLDVFIGHFSLITLMYPYPIMQATHMKHHANTNNPDKDVDYGIVSCKNPFEVLLYTAQGPGQAYQSYYDIHKDDQNFVDKFSRGILISWIQRSTQLILVVIFPFETLLLWFLPRKIGTFYTALYFSWYPHQGLGIGRYKDTKFWVNFLPRYFTHSMQLHFVHHLHPNIGHWSEPEAIIALKPFLLARGVPGAEQIPDKINYRSLIKKA